MSRAWFLDSPDAPPARTFAGVASSGAGRRHSAPPPAASRTRVGPCPGDRHDPGVAALGWGRRGWPKSPSAACPNWPSGFGGIVPCFFAVPEQIGLPEPGPQFREGRRLASGSRLPATATPVTLRMNSRRLRPSWPSGQSILGSSDMGSPSGRVAVRPRPAAPRSIRSGSRQAPDETAVRVAAFAPTRYESSATAAGAGRLFRRDLDLSAGRTIQGRSDFPA
jgi:hypothetical protein